MDRTRRRRVVKACDKDVIENIRYRMTAAKPVTAGIIGQGGTSLTVCIKSIDSESVLKLN